MASKGKVEPGLSFKEARSGRFFWGVSLAYIFPMLAQVGGIAHQYGLAREQLDDAQTALVVAILPVASIIGRLIGGWVVDQGAIRSFAITMMVLQAGSLSLLAGGFSVLTLCVGLFLFGASVGNLLMLQPLILAEAFGVKDYARIFSVSNLMSSMGTSIGPALLGFVYVANNSLYAAAYTVAAAAGGLGLLLFLAGGKLEHVRSS
jgi:predicted MFS family arabinose efflux permease